MELGKAGIKEFRRLAMGLRDFSQDELPYIAGGAGDYKAIIEAAAARLDEVAEDSENVREERERQERMMWND